mgnify:CR=1 FL=1
MIAKGYVWNEFTILPYSMERHREELAKLRDVRAEELGPFHKLAVIRDVWLRSAVGLAGLN